MNSLVDDLPDFGPWLKTTFNLEGYPAVQPHEVWHRNLKPVLEGLLGAPHLASQMIWAPEKHFSTPECHPISRQYSDMYTGNWWWALQQISPDGTTIIPLIFSTDKTTLTQFSGDKKAYPLYVTIGNIPGYLRRRDNQLTRMLIGYLPTDHAVGLTGTEDEQRAYHWAVFHAAVKIVLKDFLEADPVNGWLIRCGDGHTRRCVPGLAAYPADYPEQCLVACCNGCPKCKVGEASLADPVQGTRRTPQETIHEIRTALNMASTGNCNAHLKLHELKAILYPWWEGAPNTDIHRAITPDILHQVWQGVIKRLTSWLLTILGDKEFDARVKCIPPNFCARHFSKGVSGLSQLSGREHRELAKILLCCSQGIPSISPADQFAFSAATRGLVDFAYISMYKQHDETTLTYLQKALDMFHEHKEVFLRLTKTRDLDWPKIHSLQHYIDSIRLIGVIGGVSTEEFEHAHIESSKNAHKLTNRRNEEIQMVKVVNRLEKVKTHAIYIKYCRWVKRTQQLMSQVPSENISATQTISEFLPHPFSTLVTPKRKNHDIRLSLPQHPTRPALSFDVLASSNAYQCTHIVAALKDYIYRRIHPALDGSYSITRANQAIGLPFSAVDVFETLTINNPSITGLDSADGPEMDAIYAKPWRLFVNTTKGTKTLHTGRQDTCLIQDFPPNTYPGLYCEYWHPPVFSQIAIIFNLLSIFFEGYRVARIKCIFQVPEAAWISVFGEECEPETLVYAELFTKPPNYEAPIQHGYHMVEPDYYPTSRAFTNRTKKGVVLPMSIIVRSCLLGPVFDGPCNRSWTSENLLDNCSKFFVIAHLDNESFQMIF